MKTENKANLRACDVPAYYAGELCDRARLPKARAYETQTGRESDNADLFAPEVTRWACEHSDELGMLAYEIENPEGE